MGGGAGKTQLGDRTLAGMSETGLRARPCRGAAPHGRPGPDEQRRRDRAADRAPQGADDPASITTIATPRRRRASTRTSCRSRTSRRSCSARAIPRPATSRTCPAVDSASPTPGSSAGTTRSSPETYYGIHTWSGCTYNNSGFSGGYAARLAEAVTAAKDDVDFASFDTNRDGEVDPQELAIIVAGPRTDRPGQQPRAACRGRLPGRHEADSSTT